MTKYKEGDTFNATIVIKAIDDSGDNGQPLFLLEVAELSEELVGEFGYTEEDISEAFDPNYKERKRQMDIARIESEIKDKHGELELLRKAGESL